MSNARVRGWSRAIASAAAACCVVVIAQSCGFPDHTFVSDDEFNQPKGGKKAVAGSGGADASVPGTGGEAAGGAPGEGGGAGTDGVGGAAGTRVVGKHEAGVPQPDAGTAGSGGMTAGVDAAVDAGLVCGAGLAACGGVCVDLFTDPKHCGKCGTVCTGTDVCTKDGCAAPCAPGLTECKANGVATSICVDTAVDEDNCGGCNKPCAGGFVCEASKCVIDCGTDTRCGSACYDTTTDDLHCGNCTTNCRTAGLVCSGGNCQPNCVTPFILCGGPGGSCVNPTSDDKNCNGCNKPCAAGEGCISAKCTKLVENCTNGLDDDRDNLVDCADPDCAAGYRCASTPAGWTGPVALWSGVTGAGPSCGASGGYPTALLNANAGLVVPSYSCPGCSCAAASGTYCDDLTFVFDTSTNCSDLDPWLSMTFPASATCRDTESPLCCALNATARSVRLENAPTSYAHGACTGSQASPQLPPTSWSAEVRGCAAPASSALGCGGAQCLPKPAVPFGSALCVFRSGISSCPADYPVQKPGTGQQFYQSVLEGRSCSTCNCGSPTCGGTLTLSTDGGCTADKTVLNLGPATTCTTIPGDPSQDITYNRPQLPHMPVDAADTRSYTYANAGPVCGTSSSTLSGAPKPDSAITVCCQTP